MPCVDALFEEEASVMALQAGAGERKTDSVAGSSGREDVISRILRGGYPEPLSHAAESRRRAWFNSYLTTILQSDVRDIANIEGLTMLPRLLQILAARTSGLLNMADVSRTIGIPYVTLHRYMSLLETTFLTQSLPAWTSNRPGLPT